MVHALYSRDDFWESEFTDLVAPMYERQAVELLKMLYEWSVVDVEDIDDDKYQFAKKFTEVRGSTCVSPGQRILMNDRCCLCLGTILSGNLLMCPLARTSTVSSASYFLP